MRRIAHISDLHFGRTDPTVVEGLLSELNGTRPDLVVISGDFTMRARHSEWEEARAFLARIAPPWVAVPGNHDIAAYYRIERFINPFRLYCRYISPDPEPIWKDDEIAVICLNTARNWSLKPIGRKEGSRAAKSPEQRSYLMPFPITSSASWLGTIHSCRLRGIRRAVPLVAPTLHSRRLSGVGCGLPSLATCTGVTRVSRSLPRRASPSRNGLTLRPSKLVSRCS
jgi:hypothetical protein